MLLFWSVDDLDSSVPAARRYTITEITAMTTSAAMNSMKEMDVATRRWRALLGKLCKNVIAKVSQAEMNEP